MSPILISLISITEKLGIPVSVVEKTLKTEENQLSAIQMYNIKREIYGTFLYSDSSSETGYMQITCGPLLMAEVNFGLKEAEDTTQEFRQILTNLFILANHHSPKKIDDKQLNLEEFYQSQTFSYNTFYDIEEYYKLELLLFSHVKDRNKLAAIKTLELFIKYYYKSLTSDQLKCFYCALITLLTRVEVEKGVPVSKVFNRQFQYYEYLQEIRDINKFETLSKQAIHDFLAHPTNIPKKTYSPVTVCVLNYVENHLKEVGMHFKDFMHLKKIEKAKYFLLFSNKSINQIAEELSFSTQSHFSTVFKKIVGITPYKYQRNRVYYSY
ncbi:helix-turn-helix transcriptional regulator [Enterococcus hirae]|nr:helix-turn-helix transcriptional regulator [Enterococcus hirae]